MNQHSGDGTDLKRIIVPVVIVALAAFLLTQPHFSLGKPVSLLPPGEDDDAKISQSSAYWQSAAPLEIVSHNISSYGSGQVTMYNPDSSVPYHINSITLRSISRVEYNQSVGQDLLPGEKKSFHVSRLPKCGEGSLYKYDVVINYNKGADILSGKQYGAEKLVGRCS